ncbi:hypothetical protein [Acidovorax sp. LjRoot117]|uniref:hypothetical protein n=1 Tax=Acidovorax sp. LjRoot117 TaxID=3342255 RepID=UPI003ED01B92
MTTNPKVVCVCCQVTEVAWHELTCDGCRPTLEAAGLIARAAAAATTSAPADQRIQIGPTDI